MNRLNKFKSAYSAQLALAMILSLIVGLSLTGHPDWAAEYIKPVGTIYLNLIKLFVVPILMLCTINGMLSLENVAQMKTLGVRTYLYCLVTNAQTLTFGILAGLLFKPLFPVPATAELVYKAPKLSFSNLIVSAFPANLIEPMTKMSVLPLIVISLLICFAIRRAGAEAEPVRKNLRSWYAVFRHALALVMKLTPIGVFALFVPLLASAGWAAVKTLAMLFVCFYLAFAVQLFLVYPFILRVFAKEPVIPFYKLFAPLMSFAFITGSSNAALPLNIDLSTRYGLPEQVTSFVIPACSLWNKDGTNVFLGMMLVFLSHVYGVPLTLSAVLMILFVQIVCSLTPGIPSGILISMTILLPLAGLPVEGIAIFAGVDKIFDMGRTLLNACSYPVCAAVMTRGTRCEAETVCEA